VLVPLLPVKSLATSKGRLAPLLNPIERRLLTIAMLEDVIAALQAAAADLERQVEGGRLGRPVVISPDREVWRRAEALGCRVVEEPPASDGDNDGDGDGEGLNRSLARAAAVVAGMGAAAGAGAAGLLVVAADLPLASASALARVVNAAEADGAPVVVVPSHDGTGTNVLAWRDTSSFAPAFGPGSAARHLAVPGALRLDEPTLARDVDTMTDLRAVAATLGPASVTAQRLRDLRSLTAVVNDANANVATAEE